MFPLIESYFSVLMLFGASQAVTGIYLLMKDRNRPFSNNLLALMLFSWGFSCYWFFAYIHKVPFFSVAVTTFIGPMLAIILFPPIFLYVKYLFYKYEGFQKSDHLHFLPVYLYLGFTVYLYFSSNFSISIMRHHEWYHIRAIVCSYVATVQGPYYFIKTNRILKRRHRLLEEQYSDIESRKLGWLRIINYSFALVFIIGGISTIFQVTYLDPYILYMGYHAVIAISLFYITLMIYKYPIVFTRLEATLENYKEYSPRIEKLKEVDTPPKVHYSDNDSSFKENEIIAKLGNFMEEQKPYKNPNFSLNDLAEAISESRNAISHALNNGLNKSFYNYINELRIAESKRLLSDETMMNITIEGIAFESGFKTMSVFYRFFKDIEKVTPAVYRKRAVDS